MTARLHAEPAQPWRAVTSSRRSRLCRGQVDTLACGHAVKSPVLTVVHYRQCPTCPAELGVQVGSPARSAARKRSA